MEQGLNPFGQLRERVKQTQPEVLAEGTRFELSLSPAEKIRAEENLAFGERVNDVFGFFVQNPEDVTHDEINYFAEEAMHGMTSEQKIVFKRIVNRVIESCERTTEEYKENGKEVAKRFFVFRVMVAQAVRGVMASEGIKFSGKEHLGLLQQEGVDEKVLKKISIEIREKIVALISKMDSVVKSNPEKMPEVKANALGSFVVKVRDANTWSLISEAVRRDLLGFKMPVSDPNVRAGLVQNGFTDQDMQYLDHMVFMIDTPEFKDVAEEIKTHELIHDLYSLAIRPESKTVYTHSFEREIFLTMKDEMIAHFAGNRLWNTDISSLATVILNMAALDDLELAKLSPWEVIQRLASKERAEMGEGEIGENKSKMFCQSIMIALREVQRLNLLHSEEFDSALKAVLGAQSFKEMAYNLSNVEADRNITIHDVGVSGSEGNIDAEFLLRNLQAVVVYDFSVDGIQYIEQQVLDILNSYNTKYPDGNGMPSEEAYGYSLVIELYRMIKKVRYESNAMDAAA